MRVLAKVAATALTLSALSVLLIGLASASLTSTQAESEPSVALTKDELLGDGNPPGDVLTEGEPSTHTVLVTTTGPSDVDLSLSIIGPVECHPRWVTPFDPSPVVMSSYQYSVVSLPDVGETT